MAKGSHDDPKQAGEWSGHVKGDPALMRQRIERSGCPQQQPNVDQDKLAAIGYCFGGGCALMRPGSASRSRRSSAFTRSIDVRTRKTSHRQAAGLHRPGRSFNPPAAVEKFKKEMADAGADLKVIVYPDAKHAFTNPAADSHHIDGIAYNAAADKKSWDDMRNFLAGVFGNRLGAAGETFSSPALRAIL